MKRRRNKFNFPHWSKWVDGRTAEQYVEWRKESKSDDTSNRSMDKLSREEKESN